ncbi:hypothetical protein [Pseudomonas syringae]|uniref:hypothetical protein n=1 Tax=Pseudomonas syringae TaxID=317 RepID=UPI003F75A708
MGLIYNGDSDAEAIQKLVELVTWCRTGVQFLKALDESQIRLQCSAKKVTEGGTRYEGGPNGGTMKVRLDTLKDLPKGKQAATVLHELFHCVHRHLDIQSFRYRNTIGGEKNSGLGGWSVDGNAEEQLAITGHLVAAGNPNQAIKEWAEKGFCENRVLHHLGYPLRDSHG